MYLLTPHLVELPDELKATLLLAVLKFECTLSETKFALIVGALALLEFLSHLPPNPPSFLTR